MPSSKLKNKLKFEAIGVPWEIEAFDQSIDLGLEASILNRIEVFDKDYSRFRSDSWVRQLAKTAGTYTLPTDATPMLCLYEKLYQVTDGHMTPLIGQNLVEAGYDENYSFSVGSLSVVPAWDESLLVSQNRLTTKLPIELDFGAIGKGYLVDIIAGMLSDHGISAYVVDGSGDVVVSSVKPVQRIGLENPKDTSEIIGYIDMNNGALCASAVNRRRWGTYHHIIDPITRQSPQHLLATWVVAETALLADGLSTALFFCEPEKLQASFQFEYAVVNKSGQLRVSQHFPAVFFN